MYIIKSLLCHGVTLPPSPSDSMATRWSAMDELLGDDNVDAIHDEHGGLATEPASTLPRRENRTLVSESDGLEMPGGRDDANKESVVRYGRCSTRRPAKLAQQRPVAAHRRRRDDDDGEGRIEEVLADEWRRWRSTTPERQ